MAIRQRISGFHLPSLTSLIGCRDEASVDRCLEMFTRRFDPGPDLDAGSVLARQIIMEGREAVHPEVEDELLQYVVGCLSEFEQIHDVSGSVFWETFILSLRAGRLRYPPEFRTTLDHLVRGRPLFGKSLDPEGILYSYLTSAEATALFELLLKTPAFGANVGFRDAEPWMRRIMKSGKDVWLMTV
ncbi:hypothetical protein [Planctomyces sp. SH-PL14]|jgi:hypothetical protein|uniref:hypothetical protein n=1 Tax=Planctomyces sp. SH-PL14 TaxID=1632864 RepID=UPI00078ED83B|nr:hypothetical protein [Planctomyces sp. SH-PL14]AMV20903.1 hypothetical protein VT03_23575 [Planctomyces sp. SH-PL14]